MNIKVPLLLRSFLLVALVLFSLVLTGCGGSTTGSANPKVVIEWDAPVRGVQGPSYAASATITITPIQTIVATSWSVNRPIGLTAQTITYTGPASPVAGQAILSVTFMSGSNGTGTTVASAAVPVMVLTNGTILNPQGGPLGTISYTSALTAIEMNVTDTTVGATQTIAINGKNGANIVAIPQDAVTLTVTQNPQNVELVGKTMTGVAEGTSTIQATFEALAASVTFNVTPRVATYTRYTFRPNKIAWDSLHNKLWGTFGSSSAYPNSIVDIDPVTGAIGTPISVGSEPDQIGISADGTVAYVGLNGDHGVQTVNLVARTAGSTTSFAAFYTNGIAVDIKANPFDSSEVAVCLSNFAGDPKVGPIIYRGGVAVNQVSPGANTAAATVWTSSLTVVAFQDDPATNMLYRFGETINTVDLLDSVSSANLHQNDVCLAGDNMYLNNGDAFSSATLAAQGQLAFGQEVYNRVATDSNGNRVWLAVAGSYPRKIRCFSLPGNASAEVQVIPFDYENSEDIVQMKRFGENGMVVLTGQATYVLPLAPNL